MNAMTPVSPAAKSGQGSWVAKVRRGNEVSETFVSGSNEGEARRNASREGGTVISIKKAKTSILSSGMSRNERFIFLMRLSTMIGSKFPVTDALKLIISSFSGRISDAAKLALPQVERGVPLGDALAGDPKNFPGSIGLLIRSGSASGDTPGALREAAQFERLIGNASKSAVLSIIKSYAFMATAVVIMMINQYYIVPKMFDSPIMKMAKKTDFTIWKTMGGTFMWITIGLMVFLLALVFLATLGRRIAPEKVDAIIIKLPIMRDIVISQDNFIGLYRLSLLVNAHVPMNEALLSCAESARPGALKEDFKRAYDGLRRGDKWPRFMKTLHPTDRASLMLMPDTDELAKSLTFMAEQSKELYLERLKVVSPIMDVTAAALISVAGVIVLVVTTVPQLQLVTEMMGGG